MNVLFENNEWFIIAFLFFGILGYISWIRWRDHRWIEKRFSGKDVVAISFGINYFGRTSEPGKPGRSSGFLLLLKDRVFYRSRFSELEVDIPGKSIRRVYHDTAHKGVDLHQSIMKIDFELENGKTDSVAFKVPYPPQWIGAIENISPSLGMESETAG
jgi:hypothetical protein